jgi:hypothetical protein
LLAVIAFTVCMEKPEGKIQSSWKYVYCSRSIRLLNKNIAMKPFPYIFSILFIFSFRVSSLFALNFVYICRLSSIQNFYLQQILWLVWSMKNLSVVVI